MTSSAQHQQPFVIHPSIHHALTLYQRHSLVSLISLGMIRLWPIQCPVMQQSTLFILSVRNAICKFVVERVSHQSDRRQFNAKISTSVSSFLFSVWIEINQKFCAYETSLNSEAGLQNSQLCLFSSSLHQSRWLCFSTCSRQKGVSSTACLYSYRNQMKCNVDKQRWIHGKFLYTNVTKFIREPTHLAYRTRFNQLLNPALHAFIDVGHLYGICVVVIL